MSILHSSARPSGASRRSSEVWLREALLSARRGPVVHRATMTNDGCNSSKFLLEILVRGKWYDYEVALAGLVSSPLPMVKLCADLPEVCMNKRSICTCSAMRYCVAHPIMNNGGGGGGGVTSVYVRLCPVLFGFYETTDVFFGT